MRMRIKKMRTRMSRIRMSRIKKELRSRMDKKEEGRMKRMGKG
jgi:hypothetical protein